MRSASEPLSAAGTASCPDTRAGCLSIIICTKDRQADLARAITSIRASSNAGRVAEIVVVEEADAPRDIEAVRYVHLPREGHGFGYARNAGLRAARGDLMLFVDDDCEVEEGWVEALTEPFHANPEILGVAGAVLVRGCGLIGYAENILGFPGGGLRYLHNAHGRVVPTRYLSTCNCAYRREAVLRAGGFSEDARLGGEDSLLAQRIHALGSCVYAPAAVVYHRPRGRPGPIFLWFIRRGQSEIGMMRASPAVWTSIWYLVRSSWLVRLLGILLLLAHWPWLGFFIPPGMLMYYGIVLWRFRYARAYPAYRRAWWIVPIVKMTMDVGAEVGRWKALALRGR